MLFLFYSCTDNTGYNNRPVFTEDETTSDFDFFSFSTRLRNDLLISGTKCRGGESADFRGQSYICEREQWLIIIDNLNSCSPEGCTEVEVQPFIVSLLIESSDRLNRFFVIYPDIPVSQQTEDILESVLVRVNNSSQADIVFR